MLVEKTERVLGVRQSHRPGTHTFIVNTLSEGGRYVEVAFGQAVRAGGRALGEEHLHY